MIDDRLTIIKDAAAESAAGVAPPRIDRIKISNYKYFHGDFTFPAAGTFHGKNVLLYGENGSGKSSIYKALGYLTKLKFDNINKEKNIFSEDGEPLIEISFSNGREIIIDSDLTELPDNMDFLKGLSIFRPMLDYKRLLSVHYAPVSNGDGINVYDMLREIFKQYSVKDGVVLSDIKEPPVYFETLQKIVNDVLMEEANTYIRYFESDFKINRFVFKQEFAADGSLRPVINIEIDFKETVLENYHTFLNEARLSALAISLYFAAIRKLLGTLKTDCLKLLVLDDLLISLDMSNRLKLLEILKTQFTDFQVFLFTHDKELFEIYKNKMDWEKYEIYPDEVDGIPKPFLKPYDSEIKRARTYFDKKELDCCAMLLRKEFERFLKSFLAPEEQRNKHGEELDLAGLISRVISKSTGEPKAILERLDSDRKHLFNPSCHHDNRNIYTKEVKTAIDDLEKLVAILR
ncbi:MAG: AAA family ATPase [Candidatus Aminicenantes bacterium]|nr:AAA family ATPase [Candidatus Aminicenantes bacterium]